MKLGREGKHGQARLWHLCVHLLVSKCEIVIKETFHRSLCSPPLRSVACRTTT